MAAVCGSSFQAVACTGIALTAADGSYVQSRTIEWARGVLQSEYVVIPRGQRLRSFTPLGADGMTFTAKYGVVGLSVVQKEFIAEGINNFMEYLNQKRNIPFEVHAFSSAEMFLEFAKNNETEILLISDKAMKEEIRRYPIRQIIILSEGVHSPVLDQYPAVYKYQSSEKVIREVMACYGVENGVDTSPALLPKKEMRIIGIYSPVGRTQKTSFALTMGQILAKERAVLYLNMESYSGFERLLECSYDRGMSDILYYARQENQGIIYKLGGMVQSMQNLDYLPPAASPMDIQTAKYEEWKWLFQEIEKNSSYEVLILDLGDGVADLYQILDFCNEIYVPTRNDVISAAKMEQFENLLRRWDCQSVLDKMRKIHVPFHTANRTGKAYFEELVWSELGDYVRQILRDGRRGEET